MKLTKEQIAEIQASVNSASPAPWKVKNHRHEIGDTGDYEDVTEVSSGEEGLFEIWNGEDQEIDNLKFAAAARSHIPALLAHIAEQDKELEQVATIDIPRIHAECRQEIISQGIQLQNELNEAQAACAVKDEALLEVKVMVADTAEEFPRFAGYVSPTVEKALSPTIGAELMGELQGLRAIRDGLASAYYKGTIDVRAISEICRKVHQANTPKEPGE